MAKKFESFVKIVICALMVYALGVLSLSSLLSTTFMEQISESEAVDSVVIRIQEASESVIYHHDDVLLNVILLAVFALICFLALPRMKKLSLKAELIFITVWTIVLGAIWVNSSMVKPTYDSQYVTDYAMQFADGDYSAMSEKYLQEYSFQLGYIFFNELIYKIASVNFGEIEDTLYIQVMNAVFLALLYDALILINHTVFEDKRVRNMTFLLAIFCVQPIIFCTFTYGIIPGFAFGAWALYLEILYFQKNKLWLAGLSAVCLALAVMIKSNNYIILIAMMILAVVQLLQRKHYLKDAAYILVACVLAFTSTPMVISHYEKKSGTELGDSIPYISWIAMGMCEGYRAPGWYRGTYTVSKFEELDMNQDAMKAYSKDLLKERLKYFKENPQYRNDFFYRKFVSQWNETSYQSIWNNTVRSQYKDKGKLSAWVCDEEKGELKVKAYMDFYAQLIFWGCLLAVLACFKNKNFFSVAMPLIILGGMMYHMLSEAKSQYAISYFIMMTAVSAYGICIAYDIFAKKLQKYPQFIRLFPVYEPEPEVKQLAVSPE